MSAYFATIFGSLFFVCGMLSHDYAETLSGITILLLVKIQSYIWRNK